MENKAYMNVETALLSLASGQERRQTPHLARPAAVMVWGLICVADLVGHQHGTGVSTFSMGDGDKAPHSRLIKLASGNAMAKACRANALCFY